MWHEDIWNRDLSLWDGNVLEPDGCRVATLLGFEPFQYLLDMIYFEKVVTDGDDFIQKLEQRKLRFPSLLKFASLAVATIMWKVVHDRNLMTSRLIWHSLCFGFS